MACARVLTVKTEVALMGQYDSFRNVNSLKGFSHSNFFQDKKFDSRVKELKCDMGEKYNSGEEDQENNLCL
jgi:hypothetical protein